LLTTKLGRKILAEVSNYYPLDTNRFAIVGGCLYRPILEELHSLPAGAGHSDIDILFFEKGNLKQSWLPGGLPSSYKDRKALKKKAVKEAEETRYTSLHLPIHRGPKVDLIYLGDMRDDYNPSDCTEALLNVYFDQVPLAIQQLAIIRDDNPHTWRFHATHDCMNDIINRRITVSNKRTLAEHCLVKGITTADYIETKKQSLRFLNEANLHI
jgi:hypothetical protein